MSNSLRQLSVLLRKDLLLFTQRAQYRLYVVLMAVLVTYSVVAGVQRYRIAIESFSHWSELQRQTVQQLAYAPSLVGPGYTQRFPPEPTSVFAQGADDMITVPFVTRGWTRQQVGYFTPDGSVNRLVPNVDFLVLVLLLGGLFTIWLCHDFVLAEVLNRTILTNVLFNVSERRFVLAKVLAMILGAALPTLILFLIAAGLVPIFAGGFTADYFLRCFGFVGVLLLYQCLWVGVALLVQSVAATQRNALVYGLGAWVIIAFVIPSLSTIVNLDRRVQAVTRFMDRKATLSRAVESTFRAFRAEEPLPTLGQFEYFAFQTAVEQALLRDGAYDRMLGESSAHSERRLSSFGASALSPYTATAVVATELANTGIGTYLATRSEMLRYHEHYQSIEVSPELQRWLREPRAGVPRELIRQLDRDLRRPPLAHNIKDAKVPALALLFDVLLIVPIAVWLMERRLGARRRVKKPAVTR